jgi:hypothetical protein
MSSKLILGLLVLIGSASIGWTVTSEQVSIPNRFKGVILNAPAVDFPTAFGLNTGTHRRDGMLQTNSLSIGSQGVYRLKFNQSTGNVDEVGTLRRSGSKQADAEAIVTFFKWKVRPGTLKQLDVPISFGRAIVVNLNKAGSK